MVPKLVFDKMMAEAGINDDNVDNSSVWAFISIQNSKALDHNVNPYFKLEHKHVLTLTFDDITDKDQDVLDQYPGSVLFNEDHAKAIIEFVEAHLLSDFVIHCTAGISRSGAVGEYVRRKLRVNYDKYNRQNPHVLPNAWVLQQLTNADSEQFATVHAIAKDEKNDKG